MNIYQAKEFFKTLSKYLKDKEVSYQTIKDNLTKEQLAILASKVSNNVYLDNLVIINNFLLEYLEEINFINKDDKVSAKIAEMDSKAGTILTAKEIYKTIIKSIVVAKNATNAFNIADYDFIDLHFLIDVSVKNKGKKNG